MSCKCNNKPYETQYIGDVQIDSLSTLPEYLLAERDVEDELSGDIVRSLVRIPTSRIASDSAGCCTFEVEAGIDPHGDPVTVPEGQVRSGHLYVDENDHKLKASYGYLEQRPEAQMIMIGMDGDKVICQNSGVATVPGGHGYIVGQQYWLTDEGLPDPETPLSSYAYALFVPISETQILINMGLWNFPGND